MEVRGTTPAAGQRASEAHEATSESRVVTAGVAAGARRQPILVRRAAYLEQQAALLHLDGMALTRGERLAFTLLSLGELVLSGSEPPTHLHADASLSNLWVLAGVRVAHMRCYSSCALQAALWAVHQV